MFDIEAETIGELKEEVEDTIGVDVADWRLFQFGFLLPDDPATRLEDFRDEGEDTGGLSPDWECPEENKISHSIQGPSFFIGSMVQCMFSYGICSQEERGGEKGGRANFKTKHTEPFTQEIPSALYSIT